MANETMHEGADGNLGALRLLPWTHEGKACWLSPASEGGVLSSMADAMEAEQVRDGREVLAHARRLLDRPDKLGLHELRFITARLSEGLSDALRVAESRGIRLGAVALPPDDDAEKLSDEESKAPE
ncbi:hypothetical protein [Streptomyces fuscichromogenes]|uniref:Uncharacterized protein n=1 Tax=Streptomyces fuscichromogenes TaxID=1324013 RepID=A0A917XPF6_9ACTN|nr:hypothetical protein [Streptomyces fuscichromogenes]GGN44946.1 hypothetical protein GCM10011578_096370 [Streptomyces fuscichromogenes]